MRQADGQQPIPRSTETDQARVHPKISALDPLNNPGGRQRDLAVQMREPFCQYFNSEHGLNQCPWQVNVITRGRNAV